ncbi:MAG: 30S ribosomal protein S20 [Methylacidiphilales bacterium]|nr:30S ribosomal protein S20 [Candidatus Methylacidiphilales bacterium]
MANTLSAAKQARAALRRRARNRTQMTTLRVSEKKIRALAKSGKTDEAAKLLSSFQSQIDRAAKKGVVHKNTASRHKKRIAALLKPAKA